ncbi:hypothetical protein M0811_11464 [Anaeramoeba ignava]|uniref:TLDc domain-containing protein n=1 Tax=Anaeramoeba ignava TaxID=1746090 RepID=A0A9Q0LBR4_ANAIG|nr:hypothetical protein M0811_11464 [Anaeramoeba ignava]
METYLNLEKLSNDLKNLFQNQNQNQNQNQKKELEKEEKEKLQNQISNFIQKIRFIDFSNKELKDTLKEDLIPNQISQKLFQFQKLEENEKELNQFIQKEIQNQNSLIFKSNFGLNSSEIIKEFKYFKKLKEWINDNEFFSKMKKGYSAKKDGFDCKKWHNKCDNKGKTLIIIKTKDNFIFGGFTQVGFKHSIIGEYSNDPNAFIFSLRNDKNNRKPEKFTINQNEERYAVKSYSIYGAIFGNGHDFWLNSNLQLDGSNFGKTYNLPKGIKYGTNESKNYLAGSWNKWIVDELETYFI